MSSHATAILEAPTTTDALFEAFRSTELPPDTFGHTQHVQVAWAYFERWGLDEVLFLFRDDLRRYASTHGAEGLYHETITWAYLFWVHERRLRMSPGHDWGAFAAANPDLLDSKKGPMSRAYSKELLETETARRCFVMPDRG